MAQKEHDENLLIHGCDVKNDDVNMKEHLKEIGYNKSYGGGSPFLSQE
jgi:hypothetical protein